MKDFSYGTKLLFYKDSSTSYFPHYVGYSEMFELLEGSLPDGLSLNEKNGEISGVTNSEFNSTLIIIAYNTDEYKSNTIINVISSSFFN